MSDKADNGSASSLRNKTSAAKKTLDVRGLPNFSPTSHYLAKAESHEVTAIGQGSLNAVQDRVAKAQKEINENEQKLKGGFW